MPTSSTNTSTDPIEQDFLDALSRLIKGTPRYRSLQRLVKLGRLRINYSTVAKEAGHSRTLIGMENCRYPAARAAIDAAIRPVASRRTLEDVIRGLREENSALRDDVKRAHSLCLALLRRCDAFEPKGTKPHGAKPMADVISITRLRETTDTSEE